MSEREWRVWDQLVCAYYKLCADVEEYSWGEALEHHHKQRMVWEEHIKSITQQSTFLDSVEMLSRIMEEV